MENNMLKADEPGNYTSLCDPLSPSQDEVPNVKTEIKQELIENHFNTEYFETLTLKQEPEEFENFNTSVYDPLSPSQDEVPNVKTEIKQKLIENHYNSEIHTNKQDPEGLEMKCGDVLLNNQTSKQVLLDHDYASKNPQCSKENYSTIKVKHTPIKDLEHASNSGNYTENRSLATSSKAKLFDFGNLNYKIMENKYVRKGLATGYHIVRHVGNMEISVTTNTPIQEDQHCVRATLIRKHVEHQHHAIDQVCDKHIHCTTLELKEHVLQTNTSPEYCYYDDTNPRKSICFRLYPENKKSNGSFTISLKFVCSSTCSLTKYQSFMPEKAREMYLVLTLENEYTNRIVARRNLTVWPKAAINLRDLNKLTRMEPKGAAAQLLIKKSDHKVKILKNKCIIITSLAKGFGFSREDFSKIVDNVWNIPTTQKYCPTM